MEWISKRTGGINRPISLILFLITSCADNPHIGTNLMQHYLRSTYWAFYGGFMHFLTWHPNL